MEMYEHVVITSDQPWDPQGLIMPGGDNANTNMNDERFIQSMRSNITNQADRHHERYESDCVAITIDGYTEQLLYEQMIQSVRVTDNRVIREIQSTSRHSKFTTKHVAKIFGVGIGTAQSILTVTT